MSLKVTGAVADARTQITPGTQFARLLGFAVPPEKDTGLSPLGVFCDATLGIVSIVFEATELASVVTCGIRAHRQVRRPSLPGPSAIIPGSAPRAKNLG
jgi:hypothetical protein